MTVGWPSLFLNVKDHRISLHQVWPGPPEKSHDFRNIYDFRPRMFHLWVPGLGTEDVVLKDVLRKRKNMEDTGLLGRKNLVFCYWLQWLQLSPSIFFTTKPGEITCFFFTFPFLKPLGFLVFHKVIRWGDLVNS